MGLGQQLRDWLDNWTFHRPLGELHESFERLFKDRQHIEEEYLAFRLKRTRLSALASAASASGARPGARFTVRRAMGSVFTARWPLRDSQDGDS